MNLKPQDLRAMLETAIVAARLAGQRAIEEMGYLKVSKKNDNELVTQADAKCQQIIIERIKETYPDHGFIGEEGEGANIFKQEPRGAEPIYWVIDPIDGTNNFAHGILLFAVSIAAVYEGEPVVAALFEPATDSMFTAVKGGQAQLNGRVITASDEKMDKFSSVAIDSHFENNVPVWACEIIVRTRFRNFGTTVLQLGYVAKGSLAATVLTCPKLWDIAAGALVAETAGAVVTDWDGKRLFPIDMDSYDAEPMEVLAANKKVHGEILNLIKKM